MVLATTSEHATAVIFALIDVCCWCARAVQFTRGDARCAAIRSFRAKFDAFSYAFDGDLSTTCFGALGSAVVWDDYCFWLARVD